MYHYVPVEGRTVCDRVDAQVCVWAPSKGTWPTLSDQPLGRQSETPGSQGD